MTRAVKWMFSAIRKQLFLVCLLTLIQSITVILSLIFVWTMRESVDYAIAGSLDKFKAYILILIGVVIIRVAINSLNRFFEEEVRATCENTFRNHFFAAVMNQSYDEIKKYHTGDLMNRITSDSKVLADGIVIVFPGIISILVHIIGALFLLYSITPLFFVVFFFGGIIACVFSVIPKKILKKHHHNVQEKDGNVRCFMQECLESILIIRAFDCENKILNKIRYNMTLHHKSRRNRNNVSNFFHTGINSMIQAGYMFGFIFCGYGAINGMVSYGTLTAIIQLVGQVQMPVVRLSGMLPRIAEMQASAERLMEVIKPVDNDSNNILYTKSDNMYASREQFYQDIESLCFENVDFSYEENKIVLKDFSLNVNKGDFVALTGSSGIGKSTIMKLILGAYKPQKGRIYFNTKSDKKIPVEKTIDGIFAYVPQGNYLMSGTIREVVAFAEKGNAIDDKKVEKACMIACAYEFINNLPDKYETKLGEHGAGLSEGQMQRLAIARAIYSESPILLMDEATASLDSLTEKELLLNLRNMENCTLIFITHRKEVLKLCDYVLEQK